MAYIKVIKGIINNITRALVPDMTSATTPSGEVICTSVDGTYPAWQAFDGNDATPAKASATYAPSGLYIGYIFPNPVMCEYVEFNSSNSADTNTLRVEYTDDGTTWNVASNTETTVYQTTKTLNLTITGKHKGFRLYQISSSETNSFAFYTIQFYGKT